MVSSERSKVARGMGAEFDQNRFQGVSKFGQKIRKRCVQEEIQLRTPEEDQNPGGRMG
jgi:hypothetical protein